MIVHSLRRFFRDHFELEFYVRKMETLDNLVAGHIEDRVLPPERLEEVLASVLDRRQERAERRREHIVGVGGEGGIRTLGGREPTAVFKTAALNRSATSP